MAETRIYFGPYATFAEAAKKQDEITKDPAYFNISVSKGQFLMPAKEKDKYYVGASTAAKAPPVTPPVTPTKGRVRIAASWLDRGVRAKILFGAADTGKLTPDYVDWDVGKYAVFLQADGFETARVDVTVDPTAVNRYDVAMALKTPTAMQRAWSDFRADPTVAGALGTMAWEGINMFSRVFSGYDLYENKAATPTAADYLFVGSTIVAATVAGAQLAFSAISALPGVGTGGMMKGVVGVAESTKAPISLSALEAAIEGTVLKPVLARQIMGWLTSPKNLKWLLGSAVALIGTDTFVDFIGEESVQTAGMGVWVLIDAEDWAGAKIALDKYKVFVNALKAKVDVVGMLNPISYGAFKGYYEAALTQAQSYEDTINKNLGSLPTGFPEEIRAVVRDIIDGDTVDVALDAYDNKTGSALKMPEYEKTGHARLRLLGINAPEKSPKGEILCSDVEIFKVENKYADDSRSRLLPLNDKTVVLKIDPANQLDTFGRILALMEYNGVNINLRQIKDGLACGYYREANKYVDSALYKSETLKAQAAGVGMWAGEQVGPAAKPKFTISIDSVPTRAKLYIDDTYTHHLTPSNETELADVKELLGAGTHTFKATKSGKEGSATATIIDGANPAIMLTLGAVGLAPVEPVVIPEVAPTPAAPPAEEFKFIILSTPSRAKVYIDGIYTHHLTPSDEKELKDVTDLLTPGKHIIEAERAGKSALAEVDVLPGYNEPIYLALSAVGLPRAREDVESDIASLEAQLAALKTELAAL
jgi:endonuclease YncB( thermonuclease family)